MSLFNIFSSYLAGPGILYHRVFPTLAVPELVCTFTDLPWLVWDESAARQPVRSVKRAPSQPEKGSANALATEICGTHHASWRSPAVLCHRYRGDLVALTSSAPLLCQQRVRQRKMTVLVTTCYADKNQTVIVEQKQQKTPAPIAWNKKRQTVAL